MRAIVNFWKGNKTMQEQIYPGLQKIIDHLESVDNTENSECGFDMLRHYEARHRSAHSCGTACCIGGHATALLRQLNPSEPYFYYCDPETDLESLCGVPKSIAYQLCYPSYSVIGVGYEDIKLESALRALRKCRDTGVVDWTESILEQVNECQGTTGEKKSSTEEGATADANS